MQAATASRNVESLESRRLLSTATLLRTGQLSIVGSNAADDVVTVGLSASGTKVDVDLGGGVVQSFNKSSIRNIAFSGIGGDDTFNVSETSGPLGLQAVFYGGDGNDTFSGGSEADLVYGEAGNDLLNLGRGANVAYGGGGDDSITTGDDADTVFGNDGDDTLTAGRGTNAVTGGDGTDTLFASAASAADSTTLSIENNFPLALPKIYVIYNGTSDATVINPYSSKGVTVTAVGGAVNVTGASGISGLEYDLLGSSTAGSLAMSSTTPATFVLNGVSLTNAGGPAINVTGGQTHTFVLGDGTTSALTDGSGNTKNGTLQTDGKIVFAGTGALTLKGVKKHGVSTSASIEVQSPAITVTSAASDALHSEGYTQSGGTVTVSASVADGVDAGDGAVAISGGTLNVTSTAADVKALKTGNNTLTVTGGTLNLNVSGGASKAISAKGAIAITNGTFGINLSGPVVLTASGSGFSTSAEAGIKSDGAITIGGGNFTITATSAATGAKGISSGGDLTITAGTFNTSTAAASGTFTNSTGVADAYSTASFDSDAQINIGGGTFTVGNSGTDGKGFNADTNINVTGGTITVTNSGAAGRGFDADGNATFSGGSSTVNLSGATTLTASGTGFDPSYPTGVKADGSVTVSGTGSLTVTGTAAATGARGVSAGTGIGVTAGSVTTNLAGAGAAYTNSTGVKDSYKSAGLSSDTTINVSGGTVNLTSSGAGGRGMTANGNIGLTGGNTTVNLSGATLLTPLGSGNDTSFPTAVKADGTVTIGTGATLGVTGTSAATGARGVSAGGAINMTGGTVNVNLAGNGATFTNSTGATDSYAAAALSSDNSINITGGSLTTVSSGTGGKGLKADGVAGAVDPITKGVSYTNGFITIGSATGSPTLNITTTGARFLQSGTDYNHPKTIVANNAINIVNGTITLNSTDDGIHSDTSVTLSGGTTTVTATSATSGVGEGIEAPKINLAGGVNKVTASNDGLNGTYGTVNGGTESYDYSEINISGGTNIIAGADAIDGNGNITISGGVTVVGGPASNPEEDIDYNGTYLQNGGLLFGGGPNNSMTKAAAAASTQVNLYLKSGSAVATTSLIHIRTSAGVEIATFKPKNNNYYFHVGSAALAKGTQYQVYFGGTYTGGSYYGGANTWGLYTGGTYSTAGATLKTTFTTSASATTNTVTF